MDKKQLDFDKALKKILHDTKYFLEEIGDNEGNVYKNTLLPKIDSKKRDYLNTTLNPLASAIDALETKVLNRSTEQLASLTKETIENLRQIMEEIRLHDNDKLIVKADKQMKFDDSISDESRELLLRDGKKIQSDSQLTLYTPKIYRFTKRDILKLTYYSLIELYSEYGRNTKDFKSKALDEIKYQFGQNLKGDNLEVSLTKITNDTKLLFPQNIPSEKLNYPTYGVRI